MLQQRNCVWTTHPYLYPLTRIGSGSFGDVWKAKNSLEDKYYAIKQVKLENTFLHNGGSKEKLLREIRCQSMIECENVVKYYGCWPEGPNVTEILQDEPDLREMLRPYEDFTSTSSQPPPNRNFLYIQLELCDGTLQSWLDKNSTLETRSIEEILTIFKHLSQALKTIHEKYKIIHRDLKPENIFCRRGEWKIGDFGLAKVLNGRRTTSEFLEEENSHVGTWNYRSPEMERRNARLQYDFKTDVFSLGLIFYEILHPFQTREEKTAKFCELKTYPIGRIVFKEWDEGETELVSQMLQYDSNTRLTSTGVYKKVIALIEKRAKGFEPEKTNDNILRFRNIPKQLKQLLRKDAKAKDDCGFSVRRKRNTFTVRYMSDRFLWYGFREKSLVRVVVDFAMVLSVIFKVLALYFLGVVDWKAIDFVMGQVFDLLSVPSCIPRNVKRLRKF